MLGKKLNDSFHVLETLFSTWDEGRLLREGARVVIMGRPNAGKSTLFNALLGADRAIVTAIAGTTRDAIEEGLVLDGIPLRIIDTAGLREAECEIEREGIRRAREHFAVADLVLYLIDASVPFSAEDAEHLSKLKPEQTVIILNKVDQKLPQYVLRNTQYVPVEASLIDGMGLADIQRAIAVKLEAGVDLNTPVHAVISERHRNLLERARAEIETARERLTGLEDEGVALAADHLRTALESLGLVTGRIYHDELLDNVFSKFCIGK